MSKGKFRITLMGTKFQPRAILPALSVIVIILATGLVLSCKKNKFPVNLVIDGIALEHVAGDLVTMEEKQNQLRLFVKTNAAGHSLTITPWLALGLFNDFPYTVEAHQYDEPGGPIRFVKFYQKTEIVILVCDNIQKLPAPFHEVQLIPGTKINGKEVTNRVWVDVLLKYGDSEKRLFPGKPDIFEIDGNKWRILLIGASTPANDKDTIREKDEVSSMIGEQGKIAKEEPAFVPDCILYGIE